MNHKRTIQGFISSNKDYIELCELNALQCQAIFKEADDNDLKILGIDCFTKGGIDNGDWFATETWNLFCEDHLVHLQGWHWEALLKLLHEYTKKVLKHDSSNHPVFQCVIAREWTDDDRAKLLDFFIAKVLKDSL